MSDVFISFVFINILGCQSASWFIYYKIVGYSAKMAIMPFFGAP
jgi:uncharacterized membrane protein YuzA (DUF378 family)